jgi:hypothetical protein
LRVHRVQIVDKAQRLTRQTRANLYVVLQTHFRKTMRSHTEICLILS